MRRLSFLEKSMELITIYNAVTGAPYKADGRTTGLMLATDEWVSKAPVLAEPEPEIEEAVEVEPEPEVDEEQPPPEPAPEKASVVESMADWATRMLSGSVKDLDETLDAFDPAGFTTAHWVALLDAEIEGKNRSTALERIEVFRHAMATAE